MRTQNDMDSEPVPGYRLVRFIGAGGYGEVWEARAPGDVPVALKFIRLGTRQAETELRALSVIRNIRHPHLLDVQFMLQVGNRLVVAMPLCDRSLWDRFHECRVEGLQGIPRDELIRYISEAALALDYLNEPRHATDDGRLIGVQHRDVKPQNLFLVGGCVRVADFGLAKILESQQVSHISGMTPAYVAPEVLQGISSARSDQYSLAVTYYELACGELLFSGSFEEMLLGHVQRMPDLSGLPEEDRPIVARALAKRPEDRWESSQEFVSNLMRRVPVAVPVSAPAYEETLVRPPIPQPLLAPVQRSTAPYADTKERLPDVPAIRTVLAAESQKASGRRLGLSVLGAILFLMTALLAGYLYYLHRPDGASLIEVSSADVSRSAPRIPVQTKANTGPATNSNPAASDGATQSVAATVQRAPDATRESVETTTRSGAPSPPVMRILDDSLEVALIPAGEFLMGSPDSDTDAEDDERPQRPARITRPFYLSTHEVSLRNFRTFVRAENYKTDAERDGQGGGGFDQNSGVSDVRKPLFNWQHVGWRLTDDHPVVSVTWNDAKQFCEWLTQREGRRCRLPTEAEWEYACRAGTKTRYCFGNELESLEGNANIWNVRAQSRGSPGGAIGVAARFAAPRGTFSKNEWGLYDLHGNVQEWCEDGYDPTFYKHRDEDDPRCAASGDLRVLRGGSWGMDASFARSASRFWFMRDGRNDDVGFRIVIEVVDGTQ